jgi:hypothetical protein
VVTNDSEEYAASISELRTKCSMLEHAAIIIIIRVETVIIKSEILVFTYKTARCHNINDHNMNLHSRENPQTFKTLLHAPKPVFPEIR